MAKLYVYLSKTREVGGEGNFEVEKKESRNLQQNSPTFHKVSGEIPQMPGQKTVIETKPFVAWVLRSSLVGFTAGCRVLQQDAPHFGNLIRAQAHETQIFGLIYDVSIKDDPVIRQIILADTIEPEMVLDQRENRLMPIEIGVLTVGYQADRVMRVGLPPQPPISLDSLSICDETELRNFSSDLSYFSLVLNPAAAIPTDELLAAHLLQAAYSRAPETRRHFLVSAGRELARLLNSDLIRLSGLLNKIKQAA
jgi:hypothetical protein